MSAINTNLSSLFAINALATNNKNLSTSLQRLSTGLRINSGADDPSGIVTSSLLSQDQAGLNQAINNVSLANNVVSTAEAGINQVGTLLTQLQTLVSTAGNGGALSSSAQAANQTQADSLISEINRVSSSTTFQGKQLLNGSLDYTTSGLATASLQSLHLNSALLPGGVAQQVNVAVTLSAQTAHLGYAGGALAAANAVTLEVAGTSGTAQVSIAGGTSVAGIVAAVNTLKAQTGTSASLSGANFRLDSTSLGAAQFVSVKAVSGAFTPTAGRVTGRDAAVTINGQSAAVSGTAVTLNSPNLNLTLSLSSAFNVVGNSTFYVTGGGANFSVGARVNDANRVSLGIGTIAAGDLGDAVNGYVSSLASGGANALSSLNSANASKAENILTSAINQVASLNGRVGDFLNYTLGDTSTALQTTLQNETAAQSNISDTNFAVETANLARDQILQASATSVLATANSQAQSVLKLLQ